MRHNVRTGHRNVVGHRSGTERNLMHRHEIIVRVELRHPPLTGVSRGEHLRRVRLDRADSEVRRPVLRHAPLRQRVVRSQISQQRHALDVPVPVNYSGNTDTRTGVRPQEPWTQLRCIANPRQHRTGGQRRQPVHPGDPRGRTRQVRRGHQNVTLTLEPERLRVLHRVVRLGHTGVFYIPPLHPVRRPAEHHRRPNVGRLHRLPRDKPEVPQRPVGRKVVRSVGVHQLMSGSFSNMSTMTRPVAKSFDHCPTTYPPRTAHSWRDSLSTRS